MERKKDSSWRLWVVVGVLACLLLISNWSWLSVTIARQGNVKNVDSSTYVEAAAQVENIRADAQQKSETESPGAAHDTLFINDGAMEDDALKKSSSASTSQPQKSRWSYSEKEAIERYGVEYHPALVGVVSSLRPPPDRKNFYNSGFAYLYSPKADSLTSKLQRYPPASGGSYQFWSSRGYYAVGGSSKSPQLEPLNKPFVSDKSTFWGDAENYVNGFKSCSLDSLAILPLTFDLTKNGRCKEFFAPNSFQQRNATSWIVKPITNFGGVGMKVYHDFEKLKREWGSACDSQSTKASLSRGVTPNSKASIGKGDRPHKSVRAVRSVVKAVAQEYIRQPVLIYGSKFDLRIYLAIPRMQPYFVFFGGGCIRRSLLKYDPDATSSAVALTNTHQQIGAKVAADPNSHIWSFRQMSDYFESQGIAKQGWFKNRFMPELKKALKFFFLSRKHLLDKHIHLAPHNPIALLGQDFMITASGRPVAIESNQFPAMMSHSVAIEERRVKRRVMRDFFAAVLSLHNNCAINDLQKGSCRRDTPRKYEEMEEGDFFGSLELLYSDFAAARQKAPYNPCEAFRDTVELSNREGGLFRAEEDAVP